MYRICRRAVACDRGEGVAGGGVNSVIEISKKMVSPQNTFGANFMVK